MDVVESDVDPRKIIVGPACAAEKKAGSNTICAEMAATAIRRDDMHTPKLLWKPHGLSNARSTSARTCQTGDWPWFTEIAHRRSAIDRDGFLCIVVA
jgi:hypothetical protein